MFILTAKITPRIANYVQSFDWLNLGKYNSKNWGTPYMASQGLTLTFSVRGVAPLIFKI